MNIILVSDSLAKSRIVTISQTQIIMAALGLLMAGFILALGTYLLTMNYAVDLKNPYLRMLFSTLHQKAEISKEDFALGLAHAEARIWDSAMEPLLHPGR